jgi:tetratricopeptide (TPR) repeat protein
MNDTSSLLKDKEELVKGSQIFPIEFESGNPGSVFDRVTIQAGQRKAKVSASLREVLKDARLLSDVAPELSKSIDEQVERLVGDLNKSPRNIYLLNNLGNTYLSIGRLHEAADCFRRALDIDGNHRLAMINLAKSYVMEDKTDEALRVYLGYTGKYPSDAKILVDLAYVYLRLGKLDEARTTIDKSILLNQNSPNARHTSAILHLMQGEMDKAVGEFRKATTLDVRFTPAYNGLGASYAIKGNYAKAIKYLKIAYAIDPQSGLTVKNLAQTYLNKGDFIAATALMTEYLGKYPRDWEALNKLAYAYFQTGDHRRSLDCLQSLVKHSPESGDECAAALNNIGVVYLRMGLFPNAENMLRRSLSVSEHPNPVTYFNLTRMFTVLGRRDEAKKLIEEYRAVAPEDQTPLVLLSQNYIDEGQYDSAKEILDDILNKNPDSPEANLLLGVLYSEVLDDYDRAIETTKRALSKNKFNQIFLNDLAYTYLRKGLLDTANEILSGINWDKATFPLYATKGLLQISMGKLHEGIRLYDMAVGKAPNNELKNMVRQKKNIEVGRYFLTKGDRDEALRHLHNALSINTNTKLYRDQANRMIGQIERLPQQGSLPFSNS